MRISAANGASTSRIKLRHLTCLLEVARGGSARAAADVLHVTESAVSKTLRELEEALGLRLFERSRHGMRITQAGSRFISHAASAVQSLELGMASAHDRPLAQGISLRIGAMPVFAATVLPQVTTQLVDETPGLVLELVSGSKNSLLERLREGDIEVAMGRLPPPQDMTGFSFEQLLVDRYCFVARPGHPLLASPDLGLQELGQYPLILPTRDTVTWEELQRLFVAHGAQLPDRRIESIYLQFSADLALSSDAVWACSERHAAPLLARHTFLRLPIDTRMMDAPMGIITNPAHRLQLTTQRLLELLRSHFGTG